jgi:hypothetical protein
VPADELEAELYDALSVEYSRHVKQ